MFRVRRAAAVEPATSSAACRTSPSCRRRLLSAQRRDVRAVSTGARLQSLDSFPLPVAARLHSRILSPVHRAAKRQRGLEQLHFRSAVLSRCITRHREFSTRRRGSPRSSSAWKNGFAVSAGDTVLWAVLCLALQLLAGWPQTVLLSAIYGGIYLLIVGREQSRQGKVFAGFVAMGLLSAGLGASVVLPTMEFKPYSNLAQLTYSHFVSLSVAPQSFVQLLFPYLMGADSLRYHSVPYFGAEQLAVAAMYMGVLPLMLAGGCPVVVAHIARRPVRGNRLLSFRRCSRSGDTRLSAECCFASLSITSSAITASISSSWRFSWPCWRRCSPATCLASPNGTPTTGMGDTAGLPVARGDRADQDSRHPGLHGSGDRSARWPLDCAAASGHALQQSRHDSSRSSLCWFRDAFSGAGCDARTAAPLRWRRSRWSASISGGSVEPISRTSRPVKPARWKRRRTGPRTQAAKGEAIPHLVARP